jgi:hypothetical protein
METPYIWRCWQGNGLPERPNTYSSLLGTYSICALEEFDEFAAAVAILDQSVNRAGEQVDAGQQADRAVALIFMIAREGRVRAGLGRQIRGGRGYRLDAGFLVIGDDRHRVARLFLRCGRGLFLMILTWR